jgi:uncharacterized phage-associated protein
MKTVFDIASYILEKKGSMSAMKLQKLVYYSQAWALVWDERPLFDSKIEAWANGPVCPQLYSAHRGSFIVENIPAGVPSNLDENDKETIDSVLEFYGDKSAQWLSDLTHAEQPWKEARKGLPDGERGDVEITHAAMAEYYGSLDGEEETPKS